MKPIAILQKLKTELAETLQTTVKAYRAEKEGEYPHLSVEVVLEDNKEKELVFIYFYPVEENAFSHNELLEFRYALPEEIGENEHESLPTFLHRLNVALPLGTFCQQETQVFLRYTLPYSKQQEPDSQAIGEVILCLVGLVQIYTPILLELTRNRISFKEACYLGNIK